MRLQCWDLAGQERFRAVCRAYFRGAVGALLVFDLTSERSFEALEFWLSELQRYSDWAEPLNTPLGPPVLLLGKQGRRARARN